ncbi:MASE3 domain-containing protein [Thermodesulfobacteriota bacterium]
MGKRLYMHIILGAFVLGVLYLTSLYNYLLYHNIAEIFSIVVACGIFMIAWNSRDFIENSYLIFLGIAYLFIAILDLTHTLAYQGMVVFPSGDPNTPTQLWVAARYIESISLLIAPLVLTRKLKTPIIFITYAVIVFFILASIFYWRNFPFCFVDPLGLTPFKKFSEYIIAIILIASAVLLTRKRQHFDQEVFYLLLSSIILTIFSEMFFTLYRHTYDISNLTGHFFKIISYYLIYLAFISTGLQKPFSLILRELNQSKESLQRDHSRLERTVSERTADLQKANKKLAVENVERQRIVEALSESEAKYSALTEESLTGVAINLGGKIDFANERFASIYGYNKEEIVGMSFLDLVHPEDRNEVKEIHEKRINGQDTPSEYASRGLTKEGKILWVLGRNCLITYKGAPAILGNIVDVTKNKEMEEALRLSERSLRLLSSRLLSTGEEERKRVSREIHDGIGQTLTAIKFSVENSLHQLGESASEPIVKPLKDAVSLTRDVIEEVRRIMMDLRPSTLDDLGIIPTISWFCRNFQKVYSEIRIETHIHIEEEEVPEILKTIIFRVFQEAVNNIAKHSEANEIQFYLKRTGDKIEMAVEDNGIGFDVEGVLSKETSQRGLGLASMQERTELSGGNFFIESTKGMGTSIRVMWSV